MSVRKNNFPATVIIVIILAGAIFLLSGLCTGGFAIQAELGEPDAYSPRHWYEALLIGSFALIPSGLMLWAALRQMRRGNTKISGVIFLIAGSLAALMSILNLVDFAGRLLYAITNADMSGRIGPGLLSLAFVMLMLAAGIWLVYVGIKILRNKGPAPISPETFD